MVTIKHRSEFYLIADIGVRGVTPQSVAQALEVNDPACILVASAPDTATDAVAASEIVECAQSHGVAAFVEDDAELALALGADGLHINAQLETYLAAREKVGNGMQIGASCGASRHQAMVLAENGADYLAFGAADRLAQFDADHARSMIAWWSQLFEVPCIAWRPPARDGVGQFADAGADYVALDADHWRRDNFRFDDLIRSDGGGL